MPVTRGSRSWIVLLPGLLVSLAISAAVHGNNAPGNSKSGNAAHGAAELQQSNAQIYEAILLAPEPITAEIAGFTLKGRMGFERISILDIDLVFSKDGERLLPLLRLLKRFGAKYRFEEGKLSFSLQEGQRAKIDIASSSLQIGEKQTPLTLMKGISDLTGSGELYVSEAVFAPEMGLVYLWNDDEYAGTLSSSTELRIFIKMREARSQASRVDVESLLDLYPETDAIATPQASARRLGIIDYSLRSNTRNLAESGQTELTPAFDLYGSLFGGQYHMALSGSELPGVLTLNDLLWTSQSEHFELRAGDTGMGLSPLVLPFSAFTGISFRGVIDGTFSKKSEEEFLSTGQFNFSDERRLSGTVPLDSRVEVFVNGNRVFSEVIEEAGAAPVGQGRYELWVGRELSRNRNEIRTVITEPSGQVREQLQYLTSGPGLLLAGQTVLAGGAGSRKRLKGSSVRLDGAVLGMGMYRGVSDDLTLGVALAIQEDFFADPEARSETLPRRYYVGQTLALRVEEGLYWRNNLGVNHGKTGNHFALDSALEYYRPQTFLAGYGFSYGAGYSAGDTVIDNRVGAGGYVRWVSESRTQINAALVKINASQGDRRQYYGALALDNDSWLPRSALRLRGDWLSDRKPNDVARQPTNHLASFSWLWRPTDTFELEWVRGSGDLIAFSDNRDLRSGIPVPMVNDTLPFGDQLDLRYSLPDSWRLQGRFNNSGLGQESAAVALERSVRQSGYLDIRLSSRIDLDDYRKDSELILEYPLVRSGDLMGFKLNRSSNDNRISLYFRLSGTLSMDGWRPYAVDRSLRLTAEGGGLMGRVYLDRNANGHYDSGEVGVAGVEVMVDGRRRYLSDSQGWFYVQKDGRRDEVVVSLTDRLSALYTPTQGVQRARWAEAVFTRINLGIATLGAITGQIELDQDGEVRSQPGLGVQLVRTSDESVQGGSITDSDGLYYFGEVMPGRYRIQPDPKALSDDLQPVGDLPEVLIEASDEGAEITPPVIRLLRTPSVEPVLH